MRKENSPTIAACLFLFAFALYSTPGWAQVAPARSASTITPADARRAIDVLQDDRQRAEAARTLKAIAEAAPAPAGASSTQPAPASSAAPAQTATPAAAPATAAAAPLQANGLVAQILRQIGRWSDRLDDQLSQLKHAGIALPTLLANGRSSLDDPAQRSLLLRALATLVGVFVLGLGFGWGLRRLLSRPRHALIAHATEAVAHDQASEAHEDAQRRQREDAARAAHPASDPVPAHAEAGTGAANTGAGAPANVALVRTQRDGIEQVEAVSVAPGDGGDGVSTGTGTGTRPAAASASASTATATNDAGKAAKPRHVTPAPSPHDHWHNLRYLPYTAASLLLDLLPLMLFVVVAGLALRWFAGDDERIRTVVDGFVRAYVNTRLLMIVLRLLISPPGRGLHVRKVSHAVSDVLQRWMRRIIVLATFGIATADAMQALGGGTVAPLLLKAISLLAHVFAVILIFRLRRPVAAMLAAPPGAHGPLAAARDWLAQAWAYIAAAFVLSTWVIWALGVQDGFPKLLHFIGVTVGVLVLGRLAAIVLLGAVGRLFHHGGATAADPDGGGSEGVHAAQRYYPLVRGLVSTVIVLGTVLALLQAWGIDAVGWFAHDSIGHSLASAGLTIVVAMLVAVLVWESANLFVERRMARWIDQGDMVRAARLRTLLPMLRTVLFILVALVVGLTTLNEIGINTTPLLAGASIIGVALGFGSQKLVQDFITGIFLLMENAMQVGDTVTLAGVSGTVEYLSIRTVRLRGGDGSLYLVPFSSVTTVNNTNRGLGNAAMRISIGYESDVGQAIDALKQIGNELRADEAYKGVILADIEIWGVDAVDGSMVTLVGQIRCTDGGRWGVQRELNRRILERFRQLGIDIADPRASLLLPAGAAGTAGATADGGKPQPPEKDAPA